MSSRPSVAAIVPTLGRPDSLRVLLEQLSGVERPPERIVVVDQNDSPTSDLAPGIELIHTAPEGPAAARNRGAARCTEDVLLFLEDDVEIIDESFLECHVRWYDRPELGAVHGAVVQAGQRLPPEPEYSTPPSPHELLVRSPNCSRRQTAIGLAGGNLSIRREIFDSVGGFDERFGRAEDQDLGLRLFKAGVVVLFDHEAAVTHLRSAGGTRAETSPSRISGLLRPEPHPGELLLHTVHWPGWAARAYVRHRLAALWSPPLLWRPHRSFVRTLRLMRSVRQARRLATQPRSRTIRPIASTPRTPNSTS